jgi:hypothetical protein
MQSVHKPVVSVRFGRLPQSLDYNHILFSVQRKLLSSYDCVRLSNCRTKELSMVGVLMSVGVMTIGVMTE